MAITLDIRSSRHRLSEDGLTITSTSNSWGSSRTSIGVSSGKWYWEYEILNVSGDSRRVMVGVMNAAHSLSSYIGESINGRGFFSTDGDKYAGHSMDYRQPYIAGDVIGVALDMDSGKIEFFKNTISQGVAFTDLLTLGEVFPALGAVESNASARINLGAKEFNVVSSSPGAWENLKSQGYKPYDEESSRAWFNGIELEGVSFSQMTLDHEEVGYIIASGQIVTAGEEAEQHEDVIYRVESRSVEVESGIGTTPFDFSFAINREDLAIGSNIVQVIVENNAGNEFLFNFEIVKEDRDTFIYKRQGVYDMSIPRDGDVIFQAGKGYVVSGTGTGRITLGIPTEGKSNINKIKIEGTPEIRRTITKVYDLDMVFREELNPMMHYKKSISLKDLTVVTNAELRR